MKENFLRGLYVVYIEKLFCLVSIEDLYNTDDRVEYRKMINYPEYVDICVSMSPLVEFVGAVSIRYRFFFLSGFY